MIRLHKFPDPILRKKAQEVTDFSHVKDNISQMIKVMKENSGIGLAANQAGLLDRIFVMQLTEDSEPRVFVNPVIIKESSEKFKYEEGCLSLPGIGAMITRPKTITLTWQDQDGKQHEQEFHDLESTCIQHEIDHLNGILFPDRIQNPLAQQKIWKKYQKSNKNKS